MVPPGDRGDYYNTIGYKGWIYWVFFLLISSFRALSLHLKNYGNTKSQPKIFQMPTLLVVRKRYEGSRVILIW